MLRKSSFHKSGIPTEKEFTRLAPCYFLPLTDLSSYERDRDLQLELAFNKVSQFFCLKNHWNTPPSESDIVRGFTNLHWMINELYVNPTHTRIQGVINSYGHTQAHPGSSRFMSLHLLGRTDSILLFDPYHHINGRNRLSYEQYVSIIMQTTSIDSLDVYDLSTIFITLADSKSPNQIAEVHHRSDFDVNIENHYRALVRLLARKKIAVFTDCSLAPNIVQSADMYKSINKCFEFKSHCSIWEGVRNSNNSGISVFLNTPEIEYLSINDIYEIVRLVLLLDLGDDIVTNADRSIVVVNANSPYNQYIDLKGVVDFNSSYLENFRWARKIKYV